MADSLSTGPWRVQCREPGARLDPDGWLVGSLGTDAAGREWLIVTDGVPASGYTADPEADARAIVAWRNGLMRASETLCGGGR